MGLQVIEASSLWAFTIHLAYYLARNPRIAFLPTRTVHSLILLAMNLLFRRRVAHLHMVHGGADEAHSYGQKRRLNHLPVALVAVSAFVRERLLAHGVRDQQIHVVENFLTDERTAVTPRRGPFRHAGVRRGAVIGRLVPGKRVDLLLTCLEKRPELNSIAFHVYGTGSDRDALQARAAIAGLNVIFEGFRSDVAEQLAQADFLLHLCPDDPCPLVILEAMAADVPVVVPDCGGAGFMIDDRSSGLRFAANDAEGLGVCLAALREAQPDQLNSLVTTARATLSTRFSQRERLRDLRLLISARLGAS